MMQQNMQVTACNLVSMCVSLLKNVNIALYA
uniref:Uncharacterized protein n=1 Tax=Anguilla anguilla TaxID=7936 RepID=A0A0E9XFN0_ANGAN